MSDDHYKASLSATRVSIEPNYSIHSKTNCEEREQEFDDHDQHSAHFIVRHKSTGNWAGAMKLIFQNDKSLPIVRDCNLKAQASENDTKPAVELSGLCATQETRAIDSSDRSETESEAIQKTYREQLLPNRKKINRSIIWGPFEVSLEGYLIQ